MNRLAAKTFLVAALVALGAAAPLRALDAGRAITQYRVDSWSVREGLPQSSVESIAQTADGYLWFGTQEGLARFDGVRFAVFDRANTPELDHNRIVALCASKGGALFVGTEGGGLIRWADGRFRRVPVRGAVPGTRVRALAEDDAGTLLAASDAGLWRLPRGAAEALPVPELAGVPVYALAAAPDGGVRVGSARGLALLKKGALEPVPGAPSGRVSQLAAARDGGVWCASEAEGLVKLGRSPERHGRGEAIARGVRALLSDRDGVLWVATGDGLHRLANGRAAFLPRGPAFLEGQLNTLFEDREGSLWIGTQDDGLKRFTDSTFVTYGAREGLSGEIVSPILETKDGAIWIGTRGGGLNRMKDGAVTVWDARALGSADVQALLQDRAGDLWVGTREAGLLRLRDGRIVQRLGPKDGLAGPSVRSLAEAPDGAIWIGGAKGVVQRLENGRLTSHGAAEGLPPHEVFFLHFDREGVLWLCTNGGGLARYDGERFTVSTTKDGLSGDLVNTLHEEPDGTLWVGTYGAGLSRLKNGRFAAVTTKQGLFDDAVFRILDDGRGSFWISCNKGVYQVAKEELEAAADGRRRAVRCTPYGTADGMRDRECNGADQPVGWKTRDGRLFFPTIAGAVAVDPARIVRNDVPPPVAIEDVLKDGVWLARGEAVPEIEPGVQQIEFHYAALSFRDPSRVRFRYRLEGYDRAWVDAGTRRTAYYTNVPPGEHVFRVIACNESGVWNTEGARLPFRVRPRFVQTAGFTLLCAAGLAIGVAGTIRLRLARLTAQKAALQALVDEKVRELSRAEAEIARLSESDPAKLENVSGWASSFAAEIAQMIGARSIGVFRLDQGEFRAVVPGAVPPPASSAWRHGDLKRAFPRSQNTVFVPVHGMTGEVRGVLAVEGPVAGAPWTDSQRRLVQGFAQHLGGALELLEMRERLSAAAHERERARRSMEERGVATLLVCPTCRRCYPETESRCPEDGGVLDRSRLLPLVILGRYRLKLLLGEGGMGIVFAAHDEELDRDVAVKVIRPEHLADAGGRLRLEREARAIARIRHAGVVALHDSRELEDGSACLVMELLRGMDLAQLLGRFGPGAPRQVAEVARQAGAALSAAHRAGVVHRDVKPANVFVELADDGLHVKVVDFGLAQAEGSSERLTRSGMIVGTPLYMSPEQVRGGTRLDARSDLFSLASVLFEALTGRSPFEGGDTTHVWMRIVTEAAPAPSSFRPEMGDAVDTLFAEALAKDPSGRPDSAEEWAKRLAAALEKVDARSPVPGWSLAADAAGETR